MAATAETTQADVRAKAGKYLTFRLGPETYGVEVLKVREIIRLMEITAVPQMPPYLKGVINLRGRIVPVVDLRLKFSMPHAEATGETCIVVVQVTQPSGTKTHIGIVVDSVEEVAQLSQADIEGVPDFGSQLSADYLLGMAKVKGCVKTLLDIDRMLSAATVPLIEKVQSSS